MDRIIACTINVIPINNLNDFEFHIQLHLLWKYVSETFLRKKVQISCLLDKEVLGRQPEEYVPLRKQITISSLAYHHYFMLREKRSKKIAYLIKNYNEECDTSLSINEGLRQKHV